MSVTQLEKYPSLVIFGAGNIGRGFIAPLFSAQGYTIQFVDLDQQRIASLNMAGAYNVHEVFHEHCNKLKVTSLVGIDAQYQQQVTAAIVDADILASAVGLRALPHIAPAIAAGLTQRWDVQGGPLDILVCENGIDAADILYRAVAESIDLKYRDTLSSSFGCVRTSIGRMIPANTDIESLDITVEPYCHLPCDSTNFRGKLPQVTDLDCVSNFDFHIHKKLYLHNCTHACLAYLGALKGYTTIPQCVADEGIRSVVEASGVELIAALTAEHGDEYREECEHMLRDVLLRYTNTALSDTVARVCKDPLRKLMMGDRFLGAVSLCYRHHIPCPNLGRCIYAACQYQINESESDAEQWRAWQKIGATHVLLQASGLSVNDALWVYFQKYFMESREIIGDYNE